MIPTVELNTLMNFNNSFVCLFIFLCLNKQNVKRCFMIKYYIPHSEILYKFKKAKYYIEIFQLQLLIPLKKSSG